MRVVVTGATGNVGTAVVRALVADERVERVVGISRRAPRWTPAKTEWAQADVARDDLRPLFDGADAVIHLAWLIQPSRDDAELERVNVAGSRRVFEAAAGAGVGALVHASSIGVYSEGPKDHAVAHRDGDALEIRGRARRGPQRQGRRQEDGKKAQGAGVRAASGAVERTTGGPAVSRAGGIR